MPDVFARGWCYYRNLVHTVYREARHLGAPGSADAKLEVDDPLLADEIARIAVQRPELEGTSIFDTIRDEQSTAAIRSPWEQRTGLSLSRLEKLFDSNGWRRGWGGRPWARITRLAIQLGDALDARDAEQTGRLCEEIADVRHNNDYLVPCVNGHQRGHANKWPEPCD